MVSVHILTLYFPICVQTFITKFPIMLFLPDHLQEGIFMPLLSLYIVCILSWKVFHYVCVKQCWTERRHTLHTSLLISTVSVTLVFSHIFI
jgi:hypothetical protein